MLQHFEGHEKTVELGGSALNAIRAIAMLNQSTSFTGMIGDDVYGNKIKDRMKSLGIVENLGISSDHTGTCVVLVTPDGERTMLTSLGASRLYDETHIPEADIASSKIFHFCGYQWDTDGQKKAIRKAIDIAKEGGCLISFDVADPFVVRHHREIFVKLIAEDADVVFANEEESKILFETTPDEAARKIAESGAIAVIKLGAKGALIQQGGDVVRIPAVATTVIDTTAAGDMFAGGFLYGLSKGESVTNAGSYAARLAGDVISRYGAKLSDEVIASITKG
ncbi:MAG: adenosine kinase [Bdellovibrionota bacterium]